MPFNIFRMMAGANEEINEYLMGPSAFFCPGVLKDWDIRPRLPEICCPTLILCGRYDQATPTQMAILKKGIRQGIKERIKKGVNQRISDCKQIVLKHSAHCGMWEEPDKFRGAILDFVNRTEGIKMNRGYMGKILWVDLSLGECTEEVLSEEVYNRFLSGMGLAAYVLYKNIPPKTDPLGPDNILGFVPGLLTGTGSLFTGRWMVVGKSPLTRTWGEANCGGTFSPAIKQCGYDGIFFRGISQEPVYLYADHGKAELRDASKLWGKDTVETVEILTKVTNGKKPCVACIGPAGEKLSWISGISNDKGRMAARSGLGAVMGSKKLKAVVLAGSDRIIPNNREEMQRLSKKCNQWVKFLNIPRCSWISKFLSRITKFVGVFMGFSPLQMRMDGIIYKSLLQKWGTTGTNLVSIKMGDSPIKNWDGSSGDLRPRGLESLDPDFLQKSVRARYHCYSCPLGCGGICDAKGKGPPHKPEYETVLALGGLLLNEDIDAIFSINELLNRAGMDTISAGGTATFAIECFEKGILTTADTGGLELKWGNTKVLTQLFEEMVARQGFGDLLADGSKVAAQQLDAKYHKNSIQYAIQAGGQELAMHDGRRDPGFALHSTVEAAPGRHSMGSQLYYEMFGLWKKVGGLPKVKMFYSKNSRYIANREKAVWAVACSCYTQLFNSAGLCMFGAFLGASRLNFFEWLNAATGWQKTPEEYMEIGKRIQTLKQAFNIKHGIDPKSFKVSERASGNPPLEEGANKGRKVPLDQMMKDYWEEMGWDPETGKPTRAALEQLGIMKIVESHGMAWEA
jgi:aldehyde:ferredoxin oxidoreductase